MNIRIQVMANQARQAIQQVQGDISKLSAAQAAGTARSGGAAAGFDAMTRSLIKTGSQMQWAGRQMTYNFTLPIAAATYAGVKFSNDNAKAMTELIKVYGDGTMATKQIKSETDALGRSFEAMSEIYGVARADVIGIGAAWASAGSSGVALAKQTKITMDAMILGGLDAATATQSLIAIQAQFGQSADQLQYTIAQLNAVENQTGTTMGDLIQSMARSSGVAKAAGVDVAHLAAMTAALVPAAGSAATAGNALKTIISRLLAPTKDAQDLLGAMNIHLDDTAWKSADASARLQILAKHFEGLSDAQKQVVSSAIASRLQLNKFDVLMDALTNKTSYYYQALKAVGDGMDEVSARNKVMAIYTSELNAVLDSSPNKFNRMKVMLQNTAADAIQPLLPLIIGLGGAIASLGKAFSSIPSNIQKDVVEFLLLIAVIGPIVTKLGALKTLIGYVGLALAKLATPLVWVTKLMWELVAAIATTLWAGFMGTLGSISSGLMKLGGVMVGPLRAAALASTSFVSAAFMGMWAAIRTSWLVGLTSLSSMALGAFAVLSVGVQTTFAAMWTALRVNMISGQGAIFVANRAFLNLLVSAWDYALIAMEKLTAMFGTAVGVLWRTILFSLQLITVELGAGLARAWGFIMTAIETVLISGARALGIAWRASLMTLQVITAEVGSGITGIWRALQAALVGIQVAGMALLRGVVAVGMAAFEGVLLAAAATAGAIWRGLQMALVGIQLAGSAALSLATAAGGKILLGAWKAISFGVVGIWKLGMTGLWNVTKIIFFNIKMAVALFGPELIGALLSPWGIAIAAVVALIVIFRKQIVQIFHNIVDAIHDAFNRLPKGVQGAIMAVVNMIAAAAKAVYHWFSYLNPFAHHSPSLVENVTNGMSVVRAQFGTLTQIKGPIDSAYASIKQFKNAAADLANGYDSIKTANEVADLQNAGASPALIQSYISLASQLSNLKRIQDQYDNAVKAQQGVVDGWQRALDAANATLDAQRNKLSDLKDVASAYGDQISALKDHLSTLTQTPIQGMQAFDDAIFSNQMAQKRLQLQIAQLQQSATGDFKSITDQAAALQGQIETVMGNKANARAMGAGSEITSQYDDQIKALQAQRKALNGSAANGASEVDNLQKQLDALAAQGNILDLQKSLQFDGLTRQIDQAANSMKELPFDQILSGVNTDKTAIADLTTKFDAANAAVDAQQKVVDQAQKSVNAVQASYDAANSSLKDLKDQYDQVTQAIQDMNAAMSDANSAATGLKQAQGDKLSPTMQNFMDSAGGNFPDVGGTGMVGREGPMGQDQSAMIDQYTKDLQKQMGDAFGGFDLFAPFKDMWNGFVKWWQSTAWPWIKNLASPFTHIFDGINIGDTFSGLFGDVDWAGIFGKVWTTITNVLSTVWDFAQILWSLIGPDVKDIFGQIVGFVKDMFGRLSSVFGDIKERIGPFLDALGNLWAILKPFLYVFLVELVTQIKFVFSLIKNIMAPVFEWIGSMFHAVWEVIRGFIDIIIGIFTGDWKRVWDGVLSIFKGVWDAIVGTLKAIGGIIWGIIKSIGETLWSIGGFIISGIWNGIKAAWNGFISWIGGLWHSFIDWIKSILGIHSPSTVMAEIGGFLIQGFLDGIKAVWNLVVDFISGALKVLGAVFSWLYDNVIKPVAEAIGAIFGWLWNSILSPIFAVIKLEWQGLMIIMAWAWDNILHPVFNAIATVAGWLWNNVLKPIFGLIGNVWDALITAMGWAWDNILKPAWNAIASVAGWLWNNILSNIFKWIGDAWNGLMTAMKWVWDNILHPVWNAISDVAGWLWNNILKPIFDAIGTAWSAMGTGFQWVHDHIIAPVFNAFSSLIQTVHDGFNTAVQGIGRIWEGLKSSLGTPVQWVVDFVWNNGLRKLWNWINNLWGGDDLDEFKLNFARGGIMPGYTPGRDVHKFISPTGGRLDLSGGEAIMRPEFTRAVGAGFVNGANAAAMSGGTAGVMDFLAQSMGMPVQGFKKGGVIDLPGWVDWAIKLIPGHGIVTDIIDKLNGGDTGGGQWGNMIWGMVKKTGSDIWDAIKSFFGGNGDGQGNGGTGTAGVGSEQIKSFIRGVDPLPYIWGAVGPGGYDCSGLAGQIFAMMTGRPQFRRYFTTGSIGNGSQFGFKPGLGGTLNLGFNDHHVVGEYGGLGFEAQSTATGILTGSRATPPSRMPKKMHLATGGIIPKSVIDMMKRQDITVGGDPSNPVFGPQFYDKSDARTVAKKMGLFDQGGLMKDLGINLSGRPERVLSPDQTRSFEKLVNVLDRIDLVKLDARLNGSETASQPVVYNYNGDSVTININGDLSLPNITNGRDAETFITNLRDMAGGSRR